MGEAGVRNPEGRVGLTYRADPRPQPHNAAGTGSGSTRRRNARRQRQKAKAMPTITMDDLAWEGLPDRRRLTGSPLPNQDYRDRDHPGAVYRWEKDPEDGGWGWKARTRLRPTP